MRFCFSEKEKYTEEMQEKHVSDDKMVETAKEPAERKSLKEEGR